jgi:hypothetical protein
MCDMFLPGRLAGLILRVDNDAVVGYHSRIIISRDYDMGRPKSAVESVRVK